MLRSSRRRNDYLFGKLRYALFNVFFSWNNFILKLSAMSHLKLEISLHKLWTVTVILEKSRFFSFIFIPLVTPGKSDTTFHLGVPLYLYRAFSFDGPNVSIKSAGSMLVFTLRVSELDRARPLLHARPKGHHASLGDRKLNSSSGQWGLALRLLLCYRSAPWQTQKWTILWTVTW